MIILDTNVVSEIIRIESSPNVLRWLATTTDDLVTTVITVAEIEYGIARLPLSRRRVELSARFEEVVDPDRGLGVLPFEESAARQSGHLRQLRESQGLTSGIADMFIASIARLIGASLATRNTSDFTELGLDLINPWES